MIFLIGLLSFVLLIGSILGWVAYFKTRTLSQELQDARDKINALANSQASSFEPVKGNADETPSIEPNPATQPPIETGEAVTPIIQKSIQVEPEEPAPVEPNKIVESLKTNWMIWLGGICVGLAGVFMVKYSIDNGLLSPAARIIASLIFGVLLHGLAEWLRRRNGVHPSFAALAGGASLILYAKLLAAVQLYQLISPTMAFVLMATVSLATMILALKHGPMLAMLGLLGGYVVPILVNTGSGNILGALIYVSIISASGLMLMNYVYRPWLIVGVLVGAGGWWLLSLPMMNAEGWRGPYLAVFGYLLLSAPKFDFLLRIKESGTGKLFEIPSLHLGQKVDEIPMLPIIFGIVILQTISIYIEGITATSAFSWWPLTILLFVVTRKKDQLIWLPWIAMILQILIWTGVVLDFNLLHKWPIRFSPIEQQLFAQYAMATGVLHVLLSAWNLRSGRFISIWISLLLMAPLLWLSVVYVLTDYIANSWRWAAIALITGFAYAGLATRRLLQEVKDAVTVWLVLSAHFAYGLAAIIVLESAGLTLVLATQIVSLAWVIYRYNLGNLDLLVKLVVGVVVIRLTLNPWLLDYPIGTHWSLWTYGGATMCCGLAAYRLRGYSPLNKWLELATLHLLVLTIWSELRYWLYDGDLFRFYYGFTEAAINTNIWVALALIYQWRGQLTQHLKKVYVLLSHGLLILGIANYFLTLTVLNPMFVFGTGDVGSTPILNILLLAYGLPVLLFAAAHYFNQNFHPMVLRPLVVLSGFIFLNFQIHHLWTGSLSIHQKIVDGELYTYSIVWLLLAMAALLMGQKLANFRLYRAGIALLAVVIAKIFLIDMAGLEGLLRVASFMGLGLGLLGVAYLLQKHKPLRSDDLETS